MKLLFLRLFMLISAVAALSACGPGPQSSHVSGEIETRIPLPDGKGAYTLQVIQLTGLDSLYSMSGQFVKFFMAPGITDSHLTGNAPKTRFVKSGDIYVAADSLSLQLATVYAHMENLAGLDEDLGAGGINHWPRDIGVGVRLAGGMQNNAFYDGDTDSMLFVPYSGNDLPLAVNAGILAHEHFHSLFYKIVTIPLNQAGKSSGRVSLTAHSQSEFYKAMNMPLVQGDKSVDTDPTAATSYQVMLLRGLNEGLADFWGWVYTGDPDFIAQSIPSQKANRSLTTDSANGGLVLANTTNLRRVVNVLETDQVHLSGNLVNYAYTIGTQYSRIFKSFADTYSQSRGVEGLEARKAVARLILQTLPTLRDDILKTKSDQYYDPSSFLRSFLAQAKDATEDECNVLIGVMNKNDLDGSTTYSCEKKDGAAGWSLKQQVMAAGSDRAKAANAPNGVTPSPKPGITFNR